MKLVKNCKKCPKCSSLDIVRVAREPWMRKYPASKLYRCEKCGYHYLAIGSHIIKMIDFI
jgi:predicted RNA-binding Zn-ribbon protein involved in translation (DUF1610 family)